MNARIRIATLVAAAVLFAACGDDSPTDTTPDGPFVRATTSDVFAPAQLTVDVGATVTWVFGAVAHDVIFAEVAGAPTNIAITANRNVERTFPTAGTFNYICSIHAGMAGAILVE